MDRETFMAVKDHTTTSGRKDIVEITRRLHKIKRRLLLEAATKQDIDGRDDRPTPIKTNSRCSCCDN